MKKQMIRKVKAWGIFNKQSGYFWGYFGVGVNAIQLFSSRKKAEFIMGQRENEDEVSKGRTIIKPVTISYPSNTKV